MRRMRANLWIAWVACLLVGASSVYTAVTTLSVPSYNGRPLQLVADTVGALFPILYIIPAMLILLRQPRNTVAWLLMIPTLTAVVADAIGRFLITFKDAPPPATLPVLLMVWFSGWAWISFIFPLLLIPLYFPTGRLPTPRWRWVPYLAGGMTLFFTVISAFVKVHQLDSVPWKLVNPIGFIPDEFFTAIMPFWGVLLLVLTVSTLASIIVRYRRASSIERQQMKWMMYSTGIFALVYIFGVLINTPQATKPPQLLEDFFSLLLNLAVITIPAAIAIAILRYHLYDIDVIIRLTLIYALVTGLLGLSYAGGVILLQQAFRLMTGQASDVAVVVTTLMIAALFNPLRLRIQQVIDRRFFRKKYNAEQALAEFAAAARSGSDLERLTAMLEDVIQVNLQPTQVSLQLKLKKPEEGAALPAPKG